MRNDMTIAVLGATGMVGRRVVGEAGARGHRVLALSRKAEREEGEGFTRAAVDVGDSAALAEVLVGSGADVLVLAVRSHPADEEFLVGATRAVMDVGARLGVRVLVVGGAGALRSPGEGELLVAHDPAYVPAELRAVAEAGVAQLRACEGHVGAEWVYLSPPGLLEPGVRTGRYRRGTDTLLIDAGGRSWISAEDLAVAVLDELENPGGERHFTVVADEEDE